MTTLSSETETYRTTIIVLKDAYHSAPQAAVDHCFVQLIQTIKALNPGLNPSMDNAGTAGLFAFKLY